METPSEIRQAGQPSGGSPAWYWILRVATLSALAVGVILWITSCVVSRSGPTPAPSFTPTPTDVPTALRQRPLRVPTLPPGAPCPTAHGQKITSTLGLLSGEGPVYALGLRADGALDYVPPQNFGGGAYGGDKVFFAVQPDYRNWVLVRGRQVDGEHDVRFGNGADPRTEDLFLAEGGTPDGWSIGGDYTRVQVPGCYAYQMDGVGFTEIIVFQAVPL
jgi:hypothetical protein